MKKSCSRYQTWWKITITITSRYLIYGREKTLDIYLGKVKKFQNMFLTKSCLFQHLKKSVVNLTPSPMSNIVFHSKPYFMQQRRLSSMKGGNNYPLMVPDVILSENQQCLTERKIVAGTKQFQLSSFCKNQTLESVSRAALGAHSHL